MAWGKKAKRNHDGPGKVGTKTVLVCLFVFSRILCFFVLLFDEGKCEETVENVLVLRTLQIQWKLRCFSRRILFPFSSKTATCVFSEWMNHYFCLSCSCFQPGVNPWWSAAAVKRVILATLSPLKTPHPSTLWLLQRVSTTTGPPGGRRGHLDELHFISSSGVMDQNQKPHLLIDA